MRNLLRSQHIKTTVKCDGSNFSPKFHAQFPVWREGSVKHQQQRRIRLAKGSSELSGWVEDEDTEILKENPNQTLRRDQFQISSWGHPLGNAWIGLRCWSYCNGLVCKRQNEFPCPGRRRTRLLQGQTSPLELPKWFAAVCVAFCQMHGRIFALPFSAGPVLPSATLM